MDDRENAPESHGTGDRPAKDSEAGADADRETLESAGASPEVVAFWSLHDRLVRRVDVLELLAAFERAGEPPGGWRQWMAAAALARASELVDFARSN